MIALAVFAFMELLSQGEKKITPRRIAIVLVAYGLRLGTRVGKALSRNIRRDAVRTARETVEDSFTLRNVKKLVKPEYRPFEKRRRKKDAPDDGAVDAEDGGTGQE